MRPLFRPEVIFKTSPFGHISSCRQSTIFLLVGDWRLRDHFSHGNSQRARIGGRDSQSAAVKRLGTSGRRRAVVGHPPGKGASGRRTRIGDDHAQSPRSLPPDRASSPLRNRHRPQSGSRRVQAPHLRPMNDTLSASAATGKAAPAICAYLPIHSSTAAA